MNFRISGTSLIAVIALAAFVAKSGVTSAATTFRSPRMRLPSCLPAGRLGPRFDAARSLAHP
jgi:hypothetical protein